LLVSALYLLAAPGRRPKPATQSLSAAGEALTHTQVKEMIEEGRKKQDADYRSGTRDCA
jgi:hypothetical protein